MAPNLRIPFWRAGIHEPVPAVRLFPGACRETLDAGRDFAIRKAASQAHPDEGEDS
jgi:hypothetical protein